MNTLIKVYHQSTVIVNCFFHTKNSFHKNTHENLTSSNPVPTLYKQNPSVSGLIMKCTIRLPTLKI